MEIYYYFKCPICGKVTPINSMRFPQVEGLFIIQERKAAGARGFPVIREYDVTEREDEFEDFISDFACRIATLYEQLVEEGYLDQAEDGA